MVQKVNLAGLGGLWNPDEETMSLSFEGLAVGIP